MNLEEVFEELASLNIDEESIEKSNLSEINRMINGLEALLKIIDIFNDMVSKDKEMTLEEKKDQQEFILEGNELCYYLLELLNDKRNFLLSLN